VKSDEAWKERVKAEDAALDAQLPGEGNAPSGDDKPTAFDASADLDPQHLPPASFSMIVSMLSTQAIVSLGMIPDPSLGRPQPRLNLAKHLIDLLGVLEEKTKENLTVDEQRQLNSALHELRMAYVELSK
jgi:hypothetical protein